MQGTIVLIQPDGKSGFVRANDESRTQVYLHLSAFVDGTSALVLDDHLTFEMEEQTGHRWPRAINVQRSSVTTDPAITDSRNCFVVMPFGRNDDEREHFQGWYQVVIEPAIVDAGLVPILAAANDQPNAINDEIRTRLAVDPMVVVDLGGFTKDSEPNPNVMYELGIRHAFNLPHVIMAWEGQRLPFDIANQRILMEGRKMKDVQANKRRLTAFIREALDGNHYRPMDAVGRIATLSQAESQLGERSILRALVKEVRELRTPAVYRRPEERPIKVKAALGGKQNRQAALAAFKAAGGDLTQWGRLLSQSVDRKEVAAVRPAGVVSRLSAQLFGLDLLPHEHMMVPADSEHLGGTLPQGENGEYAADTSTHAPGTPPSTEDAA